MGEENREIEDERLWGIVLMIYILKLKNYTSVSIAWMPAVALPCLACIWPLFWWLVLFTECCRLPAFWAFHRTGPFSISWSSQMSCCLLWPMESEQRRNLRAGKWYRTVCSPSLLPSLLCLGNCHNVELKRFLSLSPWNNGELFVTAA